MTDPSPRGPGRPSFSGTGRSPAPRVALAPDHLALIAEWRRRHPCASVPAVIRDILTAVVNDGMFLSRHLLGPITVPETDPDGDGPA